MSDLDAFPAEHDLADECNPRERAFCHEYIIDLNGVQAVYRAGCFNVTTYASAGVCATNLLKKPRVQAYLEVLKSQRLQRCNMSADSVLYEMSLLSHSNIAHYIVDDEGNVKLADGAPAGAMSAIQSIKRKKTVREDKEGNIAITYDVEIKLWDKPAPLKLMGRHAGLFPDKVEVTGRDGGPIEVKRIERVIVDPSQTSHNE